jgi:hypothetical protein
MREHAAEHKWLDATVLMPDDERIAAALGQPKRARTTASNLATQRQRIQDWAVQGVSGVTNFAANQKERRVVAIKHEQHTCGKNIAYAKFFCWHRFSTDHHSRLPMNATANMK